MHGRGLEIEPARELSPARRLRELTSLRDALVGERKGAMQRAKHLSPGAPRPATSATCGARSRRWNGASTS